MTKKKHYCQFCGGNLSALLIVDGVYSENCCDNTLCSEHGIEFETEILDFEDQMIAYLDRDKGDV